MHDRPSEGYSVLVADDDDIIRNLIVRILSAAKHRPHAVNNGDAALCEISKGIYDLAILDVRMPGVGATEIARHYRRIDAQRPPIIVLTADATPETGMNCLISGVDALLTKPIHAKTLLAAIERVMSGTHVRLITGSDRLEAAGPIDEETLANLGKVGESGNFREQILRKFIVHANEIATKIEHAATNDKAEEIGELAHQLKGCAGTMGAAAITAACRRLCDGGTAVHDDVAALRRAIFDVEQALKRRYYLSAD